MNCQYLYSIYNCDEFVKSLFVNDFEHFVEKAFVMFSVKNANCWRVLARVLVERLKCAQNAHQVNKMDFLRMRQLYPIRFFYV
jgi:hypothetical protein